MCNSLLNIAFVDNITPGTLENKNIVAPPPPPKKKKNKKGEMPLFFSLGQFTTQKGNSCYDKAGCAIKMMNEQLYQIDEMRQFFGHMPQHFCTSIQPELLP